MRRVFLLTVVFSMAGVWGAAAQAESAAGPLVGSSAVGTVLARTALDGVALDGADGPSAPDVNALLALQVRREGGSWARRGALLGAVAGAVATYLVTHSGGSTSLCDRSANQDAVDRRECVLITVAGGAVGAGLGAWIGGKFPRE